MGASHDVKGVAIGSFLERIVVKEQMMSSVRKTYVKNVGLISAKPIDF